MHHVSYWFLLLVNTHGSLHCKQGMLLVNTHSSLHCKQGMLLVNTHGSLHCKQGISTNSQSHSFQVEHVVLTLFFLQNGLIPKLLQISYCK